MTYAIIRVAGKQYRVRAGERLLVDRLALDEGQTFRPSVLLVGGEGTPTLAPVDVSVTAKVVGQVKGPKVRIGKYRKRTGYRRHTGFRAALTQIEIEDIGGTGARAAAKPKAQAKPAPKAETRARTRPEPQPAQTEAAAAPAGLPEGYAELTVAEIKKAAGGWSPEEVAAALAYEREHGRRKGALAALESAAEKEGES
ncbi:MAG TPA: 50S ribosomal protein L21 [Gaiellaceae bacterium]|nr:50S ribosomal protein L21 [Gaiellaceae bacterium]